MARILILIGNHLATAPRPQKEAMALVAAGHQVEVMGVWSDAAVVARDELLLRRGVWRFQPVLDFRPQGWLGRVTHLRVRLLARVARKLYRTTGLLTPELLGYGVRELLRAALQRRADLTIVHAEGGLWIGQRLLAAGLRVGVDFEDWFSEDLPPEVNRDRPIAHLRVMERALLRGSCYALATSQAMAAALAARYDLPAPRVVYNVFPWADRETLDGECVDRSPERRGVSLHWFSQTLGPGRGLEFLWAALPYVQAPVEIHLRAGASPAARQWLEQNVAPAWRSRVVVHPIVPNHALLSRISEHDVGLSLDDTRIFSRDLTVTNKLFQYLLAGLPVIATATRGQREVLGSFPAAGCLVAPGDARGLAAAIDDLAGCSERLVAGKKAALALARTRYCWELQAPVVQGAVAEALQKND
ncbi:MAG: glycosyltransferase [Magnetococcales bacterium]|nr:glycosyltransferase [Magnetococcales bacterium]